MYRNVDLSHSSAMETSVMVWSTISAFMCSIRLRCRLGRGGTVEDRQGENEGERGKEHWLDNNKCGVLWHTDLLSMTWVPLSRASYLD